MAPELFDKKLSKITEKIDVWAMACIICEIFGGSIPYDGVKDMQTLTTIILVQKKTPSIPRCIQLDEVRGRSGIT
jgi:serine/threonine protein kinase